MGVMLIPPEEAQDLAEVLSPDAADRMKNEGVYTLGDFNSAFQCTGCIQFTTEEEEGERSGRLLYLYVRPAFRRDGIAVDLLAEMEETFYNNGIKKARFLLPEDSVLVDHLESYGFETTLPEDRGFVYLSDYSVENERLLIHMNRVKPLSSYSSRDRGLLFDRMEVADPVARSMCNPKASGVISSDSGEEALLLTAEDHGQPVVSLYGSFGDHTVGAPFALASFALISVKKEYPDAETLLIRDGRFIQCIRNNLGDVVTVVPAVTGELMTEHPAIGNPDGPEDDVELPEGLEEDHE